MKTSRALRAIVIGFVALLDPPLIAAEGLGTLHWSIHEDRSDQSVPCRVHLRDPESRPVQPPTLPFWRDHFVCNGEVELSLAAGGYHFEVERGPEYDALTGDFQITANQTLHLTHQLRRLANLAGEGWWSGETHVHRPLPDIQLLMKAEDLHVAPVITWWNGQGPWASNPPPAKLVVRFDGDRFYAPLAGEDERGGGALLYFGLSRPLPLDGRSGREYPPSTTFLRMAKSAESARGSPGSLIWVDIEKPFWWDTPIWLASGLVDSVGIANNHMYRTGVYPDEAWGRPRDSQRFPIPQGNGRYTQELYYNILNTGLRLPPSAGSASGVLPNPVGYNRVFVQVEGELTWDKWWEGLRAGRVFVSNGPLLRARANGQFPGHVFRSETPLTIQLQTQLDSRDPIASVELVHDGEIEPMPFPSQITVHESGWFLIRAVTQLTNTFRFASTGPWYVEIGPQSRPVRRPSAQFFLDWTRERRTQVSAAITNSIQRAEALAPVDAAEKFWQAKVDDAVPSTQVTGEVIDADSGQCLPSRIYVQRSDGCWFFPESTAPAGSAIRYKRQNWINSQAFEFHTTLSAHPFRLALEPGRYTVTAEHGKEYRPSVTTFEVAAAPLTLRFPLKRWINMAARGWYSGDTHVHRSIQDLPNVMAAEDLNVAFPLTYWVTQAFTPPAQGDKNIDPGSQSGLIRIDSTHVFWPRNTEYEIFTVKGRSHTLGAVFVLGHQTPLKIGAPPVVPIAEQAKQEGALLDLDKHNWPWSMALVPLMGIDLYELANNHHWRTEFGMTNWGTPAPAWMGLSSTEHGSELDWTLYTFRAYYALLNCGFRLRPSAGTANGVHPVPLGFGRVYVHLPGGFGYEDWLKGLNQGHGFVTTGPMLLVEIMEDQITGTVLSEEPVREIELMVNGEVADRIPLKPLQNREGAWEAAFHRDFTIQRTSWVAARCWETRPNGRFRFAHTAPTWFDDPQRPLRPMPEEADYLVDSLRREMERSSSLLPAEARQEYENALVRLNAIERRRKP